jgi:hypothetical protein
MRNVTTCSSPGPFKCFLSKRCPRQNYMRISPPPPILATYPARPPLLDFTILAILNDVYKYLHILRCHLFYSLSKKFPRGICFQSVLNILLHSCVKAIQSMGQNDCFYSSLHSLWPLILVAEPNTRTTEWRKNKEDVIKFAPFFPSLPSHPFSRLLVSDSLRGSNSYISEAKNAEPNYTVRSSDDAKSRYRNPLKTNCNINFHL